MRKIKIGTRKSPLALKQTQIVIELLEEKHGKFDYEIISNKSLGDKLQEVSLKEIGGKGVFVKDIEAGLLTNQIDIAIHSLKDMPFILPEGLVIAAYPPRAAAGDVIVFAKENVTLATLKNGAVVGTSSVRREMQILETRADLTVKDIRGKVETRLEKMQRGDYDAIILAEAGLARMGYLDQLNFQRLDSIPAVGQGILAVEIRSDDSDMLNFLASINDPETQAAAEIEREFLGVLDGNCEVPLAALAQKTADIWELQAFLAKDRESQARRVILTSKKTHELGKKAALELLR
ncbi:hydroxymethylbilane synthase [Lactococcus insecticola]|uniref:Porphobilinogen deaminase n=1 Tax=Pseudolactococcus insecticola TaxID=2709158 RepID=A0A6A0B5H2_9LACT|nr:hydroxymethylbilane synthase [Lactococcus insecticola]GFH39933.1 porphobilinogen deaminase [Lactococcus insecticola]